MNININNIEYNINTDDNYLENISDFELDSVAFFKKLIKSTDNIIDIGANIGCTSILFGTLCNKVFSFEPSPSTYEFLYENIQNSKLDNIETFNIGFGAEPKVSTITFPRRIDRAHLFQILFRIISNIKLNL